MNRHLLLPALLVGALAACTSAPDTQTITGRISSTGFSGSVIGARAVIADNVVATSDIDSSGAFSLDVPKGIGYRLEVVTTTGAQPLVHGTSAGALIAMSFDVCAPTAPFDIGNVVQGDEWPGPDGHDGGCGCPNPNADGTCPPPCDPTTDPNCLPPPPPCDPATDPNCLPPPPPPCDPTTDPNCAPPTCPNPNADGTCPPPCDPSDPSCVPPPPPPCDPTTDPNCAPPTCPNPNADGTCPPPCDPTTDSNCLPPPPPSCDDPSTCPPPPGQPCDSDGNCDPGQCAVPDQAPHSFGCGGV